MVFEDFSVLEREVCQLRFLVFPLGVSAKPTEEGASFFFAPRAAYATRSSVIPNKRGLLPRATRDLIRTLWHPERQSRDFVQNAKPFRHYPFAIPSVSRGILYRTQKLFRTRLYAWLPPEGEAGAERLMRGYRPCFRRGSDK